MTKNTLKTHPKTWIFIRARFEDGSIWEAPIPKFMIENVRERNKKWNREENAQFPETVDEIIDDQISDGKYAIERFTVGYEFNKFDWTIVRAATRSGSMKLYSGMWCGDVFDEPKLKLFKK